VITGYNNIISVFSCPFDYVLILDGRAQTNAQKIGVFCGHYDDVTVFSSREFLYIEFVTRSGRVSFDKNSLDNNADYEFDRRGFNISYEFSTQFISFGKLYMYCLCSFKRFVYRSK